MKTLFSLLIVLCFSTQVLLAQSDDFQLIKTRVVAELMRTEVDDNQVNQIIYLLNEDGSFQGINYEDLSRTAGFPHRNHTYYLVNLARAYRNKTSTFYQDETLKKLITGSLSYWVEHDYFGDNWHNNQISTPTNLVNLMLLMGDEFPKNLVEKAQPIIGRAHMNASGARPSGDRIVIAGILAKNLLFIEDQQRFDEIIRIIEGELKFSTGQRGMQHDYSFHHRVDRVNNTTSYGYGKYANAFGEWASYVADTRYAFSIDKINHLVDYYLEGICKQLVYGKYKDISVQNRSIARQATFQPQGTLEIERLLSSTDYRKKELEEILRLRKGEINPTASYCKFFWQTEHFVCQRPTFYTTVRMFSTRNMNMEVPYNGPGITTHHRADGTNYVMLQGNEYHAIWPVYDWQKVSGATILQKPQLHGSEKIRLPGLTDFVGAVTDGNYGAVAFDFISPHDLVKARKSWFFFEEEYVCLGANITSHSSLPVYTTINQVLMNGSVSLSQAGKVQKLPQGDHQLDKVSWVYQDSIGYMFPEPTSVHIANQREEGRWSDITDQKNISEEVLSKEVFTLGLDHGSRPQGASYQYIVVPAVSQSEIQETASSNRGIQILANTPEMQAVYHEPLGICQIAFYRGGELELWPGMTVGLESQGMVMFHIQDGQIETLTVADPSRKLRRMRVTLSGEYTADKEGVEALPHTKGGRTVLGIELPQDVWVGKSIQVDLNQ